jgi:hypothetical protein
VLGIVAADLRAMCAIASCIWCGAAAMAAAGISTSHQSCLQQLHPISLQAAACAQHLQPGRHGQQAAKVI